MKEKADHLQSLKYIISKFEEEKEKLYMRYEQLREKEKRMISEQERFCIEKIAQLEESLKRKKRDDKTFSILRKTLGSFWRMKLLMKTSHLLNEKTNMLGIFRYVSFIMLL